MNFPADGSGLKLKIELVPRPCWGNNLREQLTDFEWDIIRHVVYARAGGACQICDTKSTKLHAHESWEYDEARKTQKLVGLIGICVRCHEVKHYGRSEVVGRGPEAKAWFCKVNGITEEDAAMFIASAWGDWLIRNGIKKWKLDTHYLKEFMED